MLEVWEELEELEEGFEKLDLKLLRWFLFWFEEEGCESEESSFDEDLSEEEEELESESSKEDVSY